MSRFREALGNFASQITFPAWWFPENIFYSWELIFSKISVKSNSFPGSFSWLAISWFWRITDHCIVQEAPSPFCVLHCTITILASGAFNPIFDRYMSNIVPGHNISLIRLHNKENPMLPCCISGNCSCHWKVIPPFSACLISDFIKKNLKKD